MPIVKCRHCGSDFDFDKAPCRLEPDERTGVALCPGCGKLTNVELPRSVAEVEYVMRLKLTNLSGEAGLTEFLAHRKAQIVAAVPEGFVVLWPKGKERWLVDSDGKTLVFLARLTKPEEKKPEPSWLAGEIRKQAEHWAGSIEFCQQAIADYLDLLRSAAAIAERKGEDVHWERWAARLRKAGISSVTPRTFRVLESDREEQSGKSDVQAPSD